MTRPADANGATPLTSAIVAREALASALLVAAALVVVRCHDARDGRASLVIVASLVLVAFVASLLVRGGALTPNAAIIQTRLDQRGPDDVVVLVVAQLVGAAVAGSIVGAASPAAIAMSGLASWDCVRELAAACALSLAAAAPSRIPAALVMGGASAAGARYLGNPAVLVGAAFADLAAGKIASIGALLAAQTAGLVLGRVIASLFHGGPTPAQPPT